MIFLSLWHAAHRLRITMHDFGVRADTLVAIVVYLIAAVGTHRHDHLSVAHLTTFLPFARIPKTLGE